MKKLKIAMICDMVPGQAGGSYASTTRFAELLINRGHQVLIIAARDSRQPITNKYGNIPIYQFFSIPIPGSNRYYFHSFPKARELEKIFSENKIDIVHIMFPTYSCYIARKVAERLHIPVIAHFHTQPENVSIFLPSFLRLPFIHNLITSYLVWFIKMAKITVSPSQLGKEIIKESNPSLLVTVISNGIDLSKFQKKMTDPFFEKYNLSKSDKHILCVARFTKEKDIETLVRAMRFILEKASGMHLEIIGTGPLEKHLKQLCFELGIVGHVSFLGKISEEDLIMAYNACDLFVLPSHVELEGMVVLEAMACRNPILIADSKTSASKYFVRNNGLTFKTGNSRDLADKALKILMDDDLREKMSNESHKDAQEYDINKSVDKLEKTYESVLESVSKVYKASIVIPAHNEEKNIEKTILAVLDQNYPDFEIIVVNNASTDKTAELARLYPVKVVDEPRKGLLAARERGRIVATGDIIVQIDADCLPENDWLARGLSHFNDSRVVAVAGPYYYFDANRFFRTFSLILQKYVYFAMNKIVQIFKTGAILIGGNSFLRAEALARAGGYNTSIVFYGEDTDTAKRISKQGRVIFDTKLIQKTSARRFKSEGTIKITILYFYHFFKHIFQKDTDD
jgi:glycosyltransferase involved in cell wall biosynthesis/GT2 family glycosyltransferase